MKKNLKSQWGNFEFKGKNKGWFSLDRENYFRVRE